MTILDLAFLAQAVSNDERRLAQAPQLPFPVPRSYEIFLSCYTSYSWQDMVLNRRYEVLLTKICSLVTHVG